MSLPKSIVSALNRNPGSFITERGVEIKRSNGTNEVLVSMKGLLQAVGVPDQAVEATSPAVEAVQEAPAAEAKQETPPADPVTPPVERKKPGPKPKNPTA